MKRILFILTMAVFLVACGSNEEYITNLQSTADEMLANAAEVEEVLNMYSHIWDYSIKSRGAIPVEEMAAQTGLDESDIEEYFPVNQTGNIPDDFSTNLYSLNYYYEGTGKLEEIESKANEMREKVRELNDPPSELEKAYEELLDMFTYTEEYIEMAINPGGSLQSFNENKNNLTSEILSQHKRVEATIPNE